jgi:hypothetical protein
MIFGWMSSLSFAFILFLSTSSYGQSSADSDSSKQPERREFGQSQNKPCRELMKACREAGYVHYTKKGDKKSTRECVESLLKGEAISGVLVDSEIIKACAEKKKP